MRLEEQLIAVLKDLPGCQFTNSRTKRINYPRFTHYQGAFRMKGLTIACPGRKVPYRIIINHLKCPGCFVLREA